MATGDFRPVCGCCRDAGYYGDSGPGIKGNREYQRCDQCAVEPTVLDELDILKRQLATAEANLAEIVEELQQTRSAWSEMLDACMDFQDEIATIKAELKDEEAGTESLLVLNQQRMAEIDALKAAIAAAEEK